MDKSKPPGIRIRHIYLTRCSLEVGSADGEFTYDLAIVDYARKVSEDALVLSTLCTFDLMHEVEKPLFTLTCSFSATYERKPDSNMTWEEFKPNMSVMHIIPYLREFVSSLSVRLPFKDVLILDPVNVSALLRKYEARTEGSVTP